MSGPMNTEQRIARVEKLIRTFDDFPKPGIAFKDIFPIMKDHEVMADCVSLLSEHIKASSPSVEVIVGLDSRGFIFGPMIAQQLGIAFIPIRKAGKLPGETISATYTLEYGSDKFEAQKDAVKPGEKVVIVDDLLATGGTMSAAVKLMKDMQAEVLECILVIELSDLKGRDKIDAKTFSLIQYSD